MSANEAIKDLLDQNLSPQVVHMLPEDVVRRYKALPVSLEGSIADLPEAGVISCPLPLGT